MTVRASLAAPLLLAGLAAPVVAATPTCHVSYGGETRHIEAMATPDPYSVPVIEIGDFFLFRIVYRTEPADLAGIKLYTYASLDSGPSLIHQASHRLPLRSTPPADAPATTAEHGFTGLHFVYEPRRDGELKYWCEMTTGISK